MFARIALAVPVGAAVTAALLFLMHMMIESGRGEPGATVARVVDFVRVEREEVIQTVERKPERPEAPERAPEMAMPDTGASFTGGIEVAMVTGPKLDFGAISLRFDLFLVTEIVST